MIEINIIKSRLEKFRKKRLVFNLFLIYFAGLIFLGGFFLVVFLSNRSVINNTKKEIDRIKNQIYAEKEKFEYIKEKEKVSEFLLKSINLFINEKEKRIEWAPVLAFIGEKIPNGIWIDRLGTGEDKYTDKEGKNTTISISGYVLKGVVNERETVDRLVRNLNSGSIFSNVLLKEIKIAEVEDEEVLFFNIECLLQKKKEIKNVAEASN